MISPHNSLFLIIKGASLNPIGICSHITTHVLDFHKIKKRLTLHLPKVNGDVILINDKLNSVGY